MEKKAIFKRLLEAEMFEKFLDKKFIGTKRFGLVGSEATVPGIEQIIKQSCLSGIEDIYCDYTNAAFEKYDKKLINTAIPYDQRGSSFSKATLNSLSPLLSELRLIKSSEELEHLKRACDITVEGHKSAMEFTKKDMYEYQIEAEMEKLFTIWELKG